VEEAACAAGVFRLHVVSGSEFVGQHESVQHPFRGDRKGLRENLTEATAVISTKIGRFSF
jgi:hypothetical protein